MQKQPRKEKPKHGEEGIRPPWCRVWKQQEQKPKSTQNQREKVGVGFKVTRSRVTHTPRR
jgi:hypothetical protein